MESPPKLVEPITPSTLKRPDFNAQLIQIEADVAPGLKQSIDNILPIIVKGDTVSIRFVIMHILHDE